MHAESEACVHIRPCVCVAPSLPAVQHTTGNSFYKSCVSMVTSYRKHAGPSNEALSGIFYLTYMHNLCSDMQQMWIFPVSITDC